MAAKAAAIRADIDRVFQWLERVRRAEIDRLREADTAGEDVA